MTALLDTHTFLWWIGDDRRLTTRAREVLADGANVLLFSAASAWEIAIKARLGRLDLPQAPEAFVPEQLALNQIDALPIQLTHALHVYALPDHHRDPFDRMLAAQARIEGVPIVSADPIFDHYNVERVW